jgi:hypothetical protein
MIDGDDGPEELDLPLFEDGPTDSVELELDDDDVGGNLADYLDEFEEGGEVAAEDEEASEEEDDSEYEAEEAEAEDDDQVEPEEEEEEEPRPRKRDAERRIAELSRRAQEAERRAQEVEAKLQQEAALRQQSDIAMMTHYEQRLRGDANVVLGQIEEADAMGDRRKVTELTAQYGKLQNDLEGIDAWRKEAEARMIEAQQAPAKQEPQQKQPQVTLEPRTRDWIEKNPWFQPQSSNFDPEMHEEATIFARRLERRYKSDGRADEIGSASYFKEIDKHMRAEFADAIPDRSAPKKATPKMKRENTVAPVVRSGGSDSPTKRTAKIVMSAADRQFARNMAASGAYKKPNGQRMSDAEAERYHAAFMLKQRKG